MSNVPENSSDLGLLHPYNVVLLLTASLRIDNEITGSESLVITKRLMRKFRHSEAAPGDIREVLRVFEKGETELAIPDNRLVKAFLKALFSIHSIGDLSDTMDKIRSAIDGPESDSEESMGLDGTSIVGAFCWSCIEAFARLDLNYRARVFDKLCESRAALQQLAIDLEIYQPSRNVGILDAILSEIDKDIPAPSDESNTGYAGDSGASDPQATLFDTFMEARRSADLSTIVTSLHEYAGFNLRPHEDVLFELAITKSHLGDFADALECAEGSIVVARRAGNDGSIIRVVTWLIGLVYQYPHVELPKTFGTKDQLWRYLYNVSMEVGTPSIKAVIGLIGVIRSSDMGAPVGQVLDDAIRCLLLLPTTYQLDDAPVALYVTMAILWRRYGKGHIANTYRRLAKEQSQSLSSLSTRAKGVQVTAACHLCIEFGLESGKAEESLAELQSLAEYGNLPENHGTWWPTVQLLKLRLQIERREFSRARLTRDTLESYQNLGFRLSQYAHALHIELLIAEEDYSSALDLAQRRHLDVQSLDVPPYFSIKLLLLAARAILKDRESTDVDHLKASQLLESAYNSALDATHVLLVVEIKILYAEYCRLRGDRAKALEICDDIAPVVAGTLSTTLIAELDVVYGWTLTNMHWQNEVTRDIFERGQAHIKRGNAVLDSGTNTEHSLLPLIRTGDISESDSDVGKRKSDGTERVPSKKLRPGLLNGSIS